MQTANLFIGTAKVFTGATFQRLPEVGEFVSYENEWHKVTQVGHTWDGSNDPEAIVSLDPAPDGRSGPNLVADAGPGPFPLSKRLDVHPI